jgi:hypothetical protein
MEFRALLGALLGNCVGVDLPGSDGVVSRPVPVAGAGLPSYLSVFTASTLDPSALSPLTVIFTPPSTASIVCVSLVIGERPGSGLLFAALSFQVPMVLSAAQEMVAIVKVANIIVRNRFIRLPLRFGKHALARCGRV